LIKRKDGVSFNRKVGKLIIVDVDNTNSSFKLEFGKGGKGV